MSDEIKKIRAKNTIDDKNVVVGETPMSSFLPQSSRTMTRIQSVGMAPRSFTVGMPGGIASGIASGIAEIEGIAIANQYPGKRNIELELEINDLMQKIDKQSKELREKGSTIENTNAQLKTLTETVKELEEKEELSFLISRVNENAGKYLKESLKFRNAFLENKECKSYVMSIDIRRSTELMLKANTPEEFATFITRLCMDLCRIVVENYGVFDKFTGDGILAFFPDFFSGKDAGFYALKSASECHTAFTNHYNSARGSFNSVIKETGLGIGIDYGQTRLVQMVGGLTVVGAPVVYACRMGGAPGGNTLLNHPAYMKIAKEYGPFIQVEETEIMIKHEGKTLAYRVSPSAISYEPERPVWEQEILEKESPEISDRSDSSKTEAT